MAPCTHCPVRLADPHQECLAESSGHSRFCELVNPDGPSYRPRYKDFLLEQAGTEAPPQPVPPSQASEPVRPAAGFADRLRLVHACDRRGEMVVDFSDESQDFGYGDGYGKDCGCSRTWYCADAKGLPLTPFAVSLAECVQCVTSSPRRVDSRAVGTTS